jgi:D-beta-D-heptose 7-phosphate kinase/D-beta-D-heptose 1-phosphate adenosyltransferase
MMALPALLKKIKRRRLLVIGDVILDRYLWGDANRLSPEAPVPVVHVLRETETIGGAANVANTIAALGAAVEVVGAVGDDANGEKLIGSLSKNGITFDPRFVTKGFRTITKIRVVVRNQQLCRLDYEEPHGSALLDGRRLALLDAKIGEADGVILSDYAKGMLSTGLVRRITALARAHGTFVALDPKPASGLKFKDLDLITPNRLEAIELSNLKFPSDAAVDLAAVCARIWRAHRPRNLVITLGADGMLTSHKGDVVHRIATAARQVFDVSGAGDTVIAALTLALTSGASLEEAAHFANAAAGVVVGKLGTATVTPDELLAYVNNR